MFERSEQAGRWHRITWWRWRTDKVQEKEKFWQSEKLCCESFLLISFFMLLFFITMPLQSHPNHVPRPRHLGICESLSVHSWCKCTRIIHCTLYNQQQGDKDNRNPSMPCVSAAVSPSTREKTHTSGHCKKLTLLKKKPLKTAVLILVLWQVCHENRSRNTEGRKIALIGDRKCAPTAFLWQHSQARKRDVLVNTRHERLIEPHEASMLHMYLSECKQRDLLTLHLCFSLSN